MAPFEAENGLNGRLAGFAAIIEDPFEGDRAKGVALFVVGTKIAL